jgi:hypothetical protein
MTFTAAAKKKNTPNEKSENTDYKITTGSTINLTSNYAGIEKEIQDYKKVVVKLQE